MQFMVNGTKVLVNRMACADGVRGHVLKLRIACTGADDEGPDVFQRILSALDTGEGGVMHEDKPDGDGYAEIRVLCGLELPTILLVMASGLGVVQTED